MEEVKGRKRYRCSNRNDKGSQITRFRGDMTLSSITKDQAERLKEAGLDAYNHNIDTSPDYYKKIITTELLTKG